MLPLLLGLGHLPDLTSFLIQHNRLCFRTKPGQEHRETLSVRPFPTAAKDTKQVPEEALTVTGVTVLPSRWNFFTNSSAIACKPLRLSISQAVLPQLLHLQLSKVQVIPIYHGI